MKAAYPLIASLALAACGSKGELLPPEGQRPVPASYGATTAKTVDQMLVPPPQAAPDRADDPVKNAKPRQDDKFDLPPPG